jgi:hypothetical protein
MNNTFIGDNTGKDFIDNERGFCVSIFDYARPKTMHEFIFDKMQNENSVLSDKNKQAILDVLKICVKDFVLDEIIDFKEYIILFNFILFSSLKYFKKYSIYKINKTFGLMIDTLAKRYGKTPIEIIACNGGYSDFESLMFINFIACLGIEEEVSKTRRQRMKKNVR